MQRAAKAICLCAVAAALSAAGEQGGLTFDFEAISAKRFAGAFDPRRNVLKERFEGQATNTVDLVLPLPSTNGGTWRVSARYKLRHLSSTASKVGFKVQPGLSRSLVVPECGLKWGELSVKAEVPPGTDSLRVAFVVSRSDRVSLEYRDFSLVDETPRSPVVFKVSPMGNLDGRFAVAEGSCGMVSYHWMNVSGKALDSRNVAFELALPPGIDFVDASFADKGTVKTEKRPDGSSVTTFGSMRGMVPRKTFDDDGLRIAVKATGLPGPCGRGSLLMRHRGAKKAVEDFEVDAGGLDFFVVPARKARRPVRFCTGISPGSMFDNFDSAAVEGLSRTVADAGAAWIIAKGSRKVYDLWRSLGVRRITPPARNFRNGFMIGDPTRIPDDERFVAVGVNEKSAHAFAVTHAACPVSVYEGAGFFRTNTAPRIRKYVGGSNGGAANWEPYMFARKGCMCMKCCRAFAKYIGRPCDEIAATWPRCVMEGGEYFDIVQKFRSVEHGKLVKTIDRIVREAAEGESLGLIPGICWIEMGSWWRPHDYPAEVKPIHYAGSLRWIRPWGPYAAWESDYPYVYAKRKPLCHFFAAYDVRKTVDSDYPQGARPKLMALTQGYQCGHWLTQPEHISMAMDSYFFNGWESALVYFFPSGYDARYWDAFSDATERAARFEDFVLDGRRTDSETSVAPFPGVYASPSRFLSGYLQDYRDVSPLQCVSYDLGGSRIAAVFNFWQKGEAFFTLRAKGLKPGMYEVVMEDGTLRVPGASRAGYSADELAAGIRLYVPAVRTRVFTIRPSGAGKSASAETDASFDARFEAARPRLERSAAEDAEYEKANSMPAYDPMPVI